MTPPTKPVDEQREAKRKRAFHSAKDYETSSSQIGDVIPPPPDDRRKASVAVADFYLRTGLPTEEIPEMLMALGIHPSQPDWDDSTYAAPMRQFNTMDPKGDRQKPGRKVTQK